MENRFKAICKLLNQFDLLEIGFVPEDEYELEAEIINEKLDNCKSLTEALELLKNVFN